MVIHLPAIESPHPDYFTLITQVIIGFLNCQASDINCVPKTSRLQIPSRTLHVETYFTDTDSPVRICHPVHGARLSNWHTTLPYTRKKGTKLAAKIIFCMAVFTVQPASSLSPGLFHSVSAWWIVITAVNHCFLCGIQTEATQILIYCLFFFIFGGGGKKHSNPINSPPLPTARSMDTFPPLPLSPLCSS